MPRPRKRRLIAGGPSFAGRGPEPAVYKPAGVPLAGLCQVTLLAEELEALRLADLEDLTQEEAAARMAISRSTFQRLLAGAHRQVAQALVRGCALVIGGEAGEAPDGRSALTAE